MIRKEELRWQDVRERVSKLNPQLAKIIDELDPAPKYTFFNVKYPFGDEILQKAELNLPAVNGGMIPLKSNQVDEHTKKCLGYNFGCNPVGLLLKNSVELFFALKDRIIPYAIIPPGKVFGTWRILDTTISHCPTFLWGMTAGARSIYMLPKISETESYTRLRKKYGLKSEKPKSFVEHWSIFKEIANHENFGEHWETELLFFTDKWFEKLHDKAWGKFKLYLLDAAWQGSSYWRNQYIWDFIFSLIQKDKHIKSSAYINDIVKHLLTIAVGALPGFRPAIDDLLAPINRLQKVYMEDYNLKEYAPIIMQPTIFTPLENCLPIYYSLNYPTSIEFSLKSSEKTSILTDIYLVKLLLQKYLSEIKTGNLNISNTPLGCIAQTVKFNCFHTNKSDLTDILEANKVLETDQNFSQLCENKLFPQYSAFFNGCMQIAHQN